MHTIQTSILVMIDDLCVCYRYIVNRRIFVIRVTDFLTTDHSTFVCNFYHHHNTYNVHVHVGIHLRVRLAGCTVFLQVWQRD